MFLHTLCNTVCVQSKTEIEIRTLIPNYSPFIYEATGEGNKSDRFKYFLEF